MCVLPEVGSSAWQGLSSSTPDCVSRSHTCRAPCHTVFPHDSSEGDLSSTRPVKTHTYKTINIIIIIITRHTSPACVCVWRTHSYLRQRAAAVFTQWRVAAGASFLTHPSIGADESAAHTQHTHQTSTHTHTHL